MEFSYFNTMEDFVVGGQLLFKARFSRRSARFIVLVIINPLLGVLLSVSFFLCGYSYAGVAMLFLAFVALLVGYFIAPRLSSFSIRRSKRILDQIHIERNLVVHENDLSFVSKKDKEIQKTVEFSEIKKVIEENGRIFVISHKNIIEFIIPNNVFNTTSDKDKFIKLITQK